MQIEVLQLQCPRADLAKINTSELAAGSTAQAMETLKKLGPVTQAHRIDIPVLFNTGSEASIRCGARVPVVRDITVGGGGKVTPSVDYQDTGASVELNGAWVEENGGTRAEAFVAVEWSSLGSSSVSVAEGVKLPTFGQYKFKQPLQCISGESVVYVINQSGNPGDDKADTTVGVVRVTMTQLGR